MINETGILAKHTLAQLNDWDSWDNSILRNRRMVPIDPSVENFGLLFMTRSLPPSSFSHIVGGLMLAAAVSHATLSTPNYLEDTCHFVPVCYRQSDSQPITQREQRARSIRTLSLQTEANVARVLDFERPFPAEESSYNPAMPQMPQLPKILKLKR